MGALELIRNNEVKKIIKKRKTKIDEYNLSSKVINYLADNKSYAYIAKQLTQYVKNRKINPNPDFSIQKQAVKVWWMENVSAYSEIMNEKRNALATQRHRRYLDKGVKVREKIQEDLKKDANKAFDLAENSFGVEAAARIREKIVKVQESGEKAISEQSPNLSVTTVIVNPLDKFSKGIKETIDKMEDEEGNTIDIEYEEVEYEDIEVEEDEDKTRDSKGDKKKKEE